jgi:membrane-bound lytic murein transglycosylase B
MFDGFYRFTIVTALCGCLFTGVSHAEMTGQTMPYGERVDVAEYLDALSRDHGFDRSQLQLWFADVAQRQDIIDRISRPAEQVWSWAKYRNHLVDQARIDQGVAFWSANRATLDRAWQQYGVAPEYVVAILGIETRYGQVTGSFPVLDALTTLGFDYAPRATFFRKELTEFLLLAREEGKDPRELTGSYAGAMGYGQFIPSSYRHYAVDFDADGVRDIWQNPVDAIGSVANYFARHKWRGTGPVAVPVEVVGGEAAALANRSLDLRHTVGELAVLGVQVGADEQQVPAAAKAALFMLDGESGDEYWLGLHDFHVITRYNRSHMYAMAVHQLAQAIRQRHSVDLAARR